MALTKEEVKHVADLAKIAVLDTEIDLYAKQLEDIMTEIDKINKADINVDGKMIVPNNQVNIYNDDKHENLLSKDQIFKNVKNHNEDFIIVPKVIE